jgi:hypothetical protein
MKPLSSSFKRRDLGHGRTSQPQPSPLLQATSVPHYHHNVRPLAVQEAKARPRGLVLKEEVEVAVVEENWGHALPQHRNGQGDVPQ